MGSTWIFLPWAYSVSRPNQVTEKGDIQLERGGEGEKERGKAGENN